MTFVFTTLLELVAALVYKTLKLSDQNIYRNYSNKIDPSKVLVKKSTNNSHDRSETTVTTQEDVDKKLVCAERWFAALYFVIFTIFCLQYWLTIMFV